MKCLKVDTKQTVEPVKTLQDSRYVSVSEPAEKGLLFR